MTLRNALWFLALAVLLVAGLNAASRLLGPPLDEARHARELAGLKGRSLWVVGASTSHGIDPHRLMTDSAAFHGASDIFESEAVISHLLASGERPDIAIVVVGPGITRTDSGSRAGYNSDLRKSLYRVLYADGYRGVIGGDWRNLMTGLLVPALGDRAWRQHAIWLRNVLTGKAAERIAEREPPIRPPASPSSLRRLVSDHATVRSAEYDRMAYYDSRLTERTGQSMIRIADRLRQNRGRVVFVITPVTDAAIAYLEQNDGGLRTELQRALDAARARGADVVDDLRVAGISDHPTLFLDSEHLNQAGARKYSDSLAQRLFRSAGAALPIKSTGVDGRAANRS